MPSGNEIGADELLWIPGGKTLGGFSEAIIEPIKVKKYEYIHNSNNYPMKREDEIIKSLNYTRCSKEYNIVKKSVFDGNLINIIVVKHYDSNAEVIDCSNIVWALHAMLVDNEVSLDRINKINNDVEVNRKNVCRILYFIYLCKIKLYIDRYLVFDYSNLYERIKKKNLLS